MAITEDSGDTDFGIEVILAADVTLLELAGELDLSTAASLHECLTLPEVHDATALSVDLTRVTFLGSTGIELLVSACKRIRPVGGSFSLGGGSGIAQRAIEVSGLVGYFEVQRVA